MWPAAASSYERSTSAGAAEVVSTTTGSRRTCGASSARIAASTSWPDSRGRLRSSSTRSGAAPACSSASASSPSAATRMATSGRASASAIRISSASPALSSTSRTAGFGAGVIRWPAMIARYTRPELGSIWTDEARMTAWRDVEVAAAEELDGPTPDELGAIRAATFTVQKVQQREQVTDHDVAAFVDVLAASAGPAGRWIHFGLTSSDVLDTALALQLRRAGTVIVPGARELAAALAERARENAETLCVGRTHGVHAEPTSFGLKLAGFALEAHRNAERLEHAFALAGAGLERFAQEVRHLQRTEVREVEEPFRAGQKGSSAMPHKRNPITTERICGLARVLRGYAQTGLENVALWHERDISHSGAERVVLPDATILLDYMQHLAVRIVEGMTVHADRMRANLELTHGALFSQRALTALIEAGMTRDEAYRVVQDAAQRAWDTGTPFRDLLAEKAPDLDLDEV